MRKKALLLGLALTLVLVGFGIYFTFQTPKPTDFPRVSFIGSTRGPASTGRGRRYVPSTVLYKIKDDLTEDEKQKLDSTLADYGIQVEKKMLKGHLHYARIHNQRNLTEQEVASALQATGAVDFAEPDGILTPNFTSNDTYLTSQWHHSVIRSYEAWDTTMGVPTVTVATCDTGVDATHEDLKANLLPGYNAVDGNNLNLVPNNPHGTMTAGTIAAAINNGIGVSGVAGKVRLLPIRISNTADGSSTFSAMTSCVDYAIQMGVKVVNISYSGADSSSIDLAAQNLRAAGGLLAMAAGNNGADVSANPDFASFLIVGATDANDLKADFSNYGTPIDLMAPGVDIFTTTIGGYAYASGTSFSAPLVSGAAALIYSLNPNFSPSQVENFLLSTAKPMGSSDDPNYGHGRLDVAAAVAMAQRSITSGPSPTQILTLANTSLAANAGQNVTLTTRFQAVPIDKNDKVFIQFVNSSGVTASFNADYMPSVPTTQWNGLVTYKRTITIPKATAGGTYTVRMGLVENISPYTNRVVLTMGPGVTVDNNLRYTVGTLTVRRR